MRILSNRNKLFVCLSLALASVMSGDVALSQGRKGASASRSVRESVTRSVMAAIATHRRASADDASQAPAQGATRWRQTSGPEGGAILTLFSNGPNLFAGTFGGVFRSTNQGNNWTAVNTGLPPLTLVTSFAASGTNLFAGSPIGSVFRSSNNGDSWTEVSIGLPPLPLPPLLMAVAVSGTNIFALTGGGVFRSNNQGERWTAVNTGLPPVPAALPLLPGANPLAVVGTNIFVGIADLVYRSTNQGESWTQVSAGLPGQDINVMIASGTTLFVGIEEGGVYRSTNQGDNWVEVNTGLTSPLVSAFTAVGTTLFAGTIDSGVFRSTNQGDSWTEVSTGLTGPVVSALTAGGTTLFAGTFGSGVFRSTNQGDNWTVANGGLISTFVEALAVSGPNIFAGGLFTGVFRSSNQGRTWTAINTGLSLPLVNALAAVGTSLFAGTLGGVYRSTDQGDNWTEANTGLPQAATVTSFAAVGTNLFVGLAGLFESDGVYRSTNQGNDWTPVNTGLTNTLVQALAVSGTNLFAGTEGSGVFRSTNQGESWTLVDAGLPAKARILCLAVSGTTLFAGTEGRGVFRSTNQGESWTEVNAGLTIPFVNALATSGTNIFAGTLGVGVFHSTNNGERWTAINEGLTNPSVLSLAVSGTSLLAGTLGGGVFITDPLAGLVASVSAASFSGTELAPESIVATFGAGLAGATATATTQPLPTTLAGTSVRFRDALAQERPAPLFFVSPGQLNFQIPPGTAPGAANVIVTSGDGAVSSGTVQIAPVAPGMFAANANGQGVAAAVALRVKADGARSFEPVARFDASQNRFVNIPIDLGPDMGTASDQVFLILFGTGVRFRSALSSVTARIGGATGVDAPAFYAGPQGDFVGLDQINLPLSRSLAGRGEVTIGVTVDGKRANLVSMSIR